MPKYLYESWENISSWVVVEADSKAEAYELGRAAFTMDLPKGVSWQNVGDNGESAEPLEEPRVGIYQDDWAGRKMYVSRDATGTPIVTQASKEQRIAWIDEDIAVYEAALLNPDYVLSVRETIIHKLAALYTARDKFRYPNIYGEQE